MNHGKGHGWMDQSEQSSLGNGYHCIGGQGLGDSTAMSHRDEEKDDGDGDGDGGGWKKRICLASHKKKENVKKRIPIIQLAKRRPQEHGANRIWTSAIHLIGKRLAKRQVVLLSMKPRDASRQIELRKLPSP